MHIYDFLSRPVFKICPNALLCLVCIFYVPEIMAQDKSSLEELIGRWHGQGQLFNMDASFIMVWEPVLGQKFVRLKFENRIKMNDGNDRVMTAQAFYKNMSPGTYEGTWFDSRGMILPLSSSVNGNEITTIWGSPETEQGRTVYKIISQNRVEVADFVLRQEQWQQFGQAIYNRVAESN